MSDQMIELTADIVSAYVAKNSIPMSELSTVIGAVHAALQNLAGGAMAAPIEPPKEPAVTIRKSVTAEQITCLDCGKGFKSLKRHLRTEHDLSADAYREKWGLKVDYPMVAPAYAERRSALAVSMGLGQRRRGDARAAK